MARLVSPDCDFPVSSKENILLNEFILLHKSVLSSGLTVDQIKKVKCLKYESCLDKKPNTVTSLTITVLIVCVATFLGSIVLKLPFFDGIMKSALGVKCVVPNNYLVWEATRPVADCGICRGVNSVLILPNITRDEFKKYAYSYRPLIVKGAALHWPALKYFSFEFFKELFESTPGSYESIEEECQFLNFKTELHSLKEVFSMSPKRIQNSQGEKSWYVGWSNCHPKILEEMHSYYEKPHFLPSDAEHSHVDYVFMGYQQGAFMHLDYISRLMWQAQLQGHKLWQLNPPPECEAVCEPFSFVVHPGDILLLDTRQWYHDTHVLNNEFSLTVSSEYG